jgi:cyclopropane-fatty-acyl-phospholipid synthase
MTHAAPSWLAEQLLDRDLLPDRAIRSGIRRIIAARAREQAAAAPGTESVRLRQFAAERSQGPIAIATVQANPRHREPPVEFYRLTLGPHLKYSSSLWEGVTTTLEDAEAQMLALTADRAGLADGQRIRDLGCGWGSLSLWLARR